MQNEVKESRVKPLETGVTLGLHGFVRNFIENFGFSASSAEVKAWTLTNDGLEQVTFVVYRRIYTIYWSDSKSAYILKHHADKE